MLASGSQILTEIGFGFSAIMFIVGIAAALIATTRTSGISESNVIMKTTNDELRSTIKDRDATIDEMQKKRDLALAEQKADYSEKIGNLQGQIDVLVGPLADRIVQAVFTAAEKGAKA